MQLFQQQYKIFGSFGASMRNIRDSLAKMADGMLPVIDTEIALADLERGLARLESRQVFGKIVVHVLGALRWRSARSARRLQRGLRRVGNAALGFLTVGSAARMRG